MKSIVLFHRRPDLNRAEFHDYYETKHVPLAVKHVHFNKYVRNHVIAPANAEFDTMSEFWLADPAAAGALATSASGAILRADEAKFMRAERFRATAEESLIAGAPREIEVDPVRRYALMLKRPQGVSDADMTTMVVNWAHRLFAGNTLTRVTMDIVRPFPGGGFPADAIVSLWPNDRFDEGGLLAAGAIGQAGILTLDSHETPRGFLDVAH